jgi:predicted secreted protein
MAAQSGRQMILKKGSTAVAGLTSTNLTINNEGIDITDIGDAGWRTMLADVGARSVDASCDGVLLNGDLLAVSVGGGSGLLAAYTVEVNGIGDFTGNWFLSNFTINGPMADAVRFTASIQSAGTITFTAD